MEEEEIVMLWCARCRDVHEQHGNFAFRCPSDPPNMLRAVGTITSSDMKEGRDG